MRPPRLAATAPRRKFSNCTFGIFFSPIEFQFLPVARIDHATVQLALLTDTDDLGQPSPTPPAGRRSRPLKQIPITAQKPITHQRSDT
jgi:hypothetical protein